MLSSNKHKQCGTRLNGKHCLHLQSYVCCQLVTVRERTSDWYFYVFFSFMSEDYALYIKVITMMYRYTRYEYLVTVTIIQSYGLWKYQCHLRSSWHELLLHNLRQIKQCLIFEIPIMRCICSRHLFLYQVRKHFHTSKGHFFLWPPYLIDQSNFINKMVLVKAISFTVISLWFCELHLINWI